MAQRQEAALRRVGPVRPPLTSATTYFPERGTGQRNTHVLPAVRAPEPLVRAVAEHGNAHGLTYSQAVRELLHRGLEKAARDD